MAKMTADEAFDKAFEKGRKIGWRKGFRDCQIMHIMHTHDNEAAQQNAHLTDGILRDFLDSLTSDELSALETLLSSAHQQVA